MKNKILENLQFFVLAGLIIGQCAVGENFWIGQGFYLVANIVATLRGFLLNRPVADKVKDTAMLCITIGLILIRIINI